MNMMGWYTHTLAWIQVGVGVNRGSGPPWKFSSVIIFFFLENKQWDPPPLEKLGGHLKKFGPPPHLETI